MNFWKMTGGGNDFILIKDGPGIRYSAIARKLCDRKFGAGADGLLAVKKNGIFLSVRYFNSDGSEAFCGNGSRCSAFWAWKSGLSGKKIFLKTAAGTLSARILSSGRVKLEMPLPGLIKLFIKGDFSRRFKEVHFANTGVPHAVVIVEDEEKIDVFTEGKKIRMDRFFSPDGTNVNFAAFRNGKIFVRTYERGVEDETLSCGTGIAACAAIFWKLNKVVSPVKLVSRSKAEFKVDIEGKEKIEKLWAEGPATIVFKGETV
ncbi:MAG: diaminopimelate epimerase [Elusimicrobiota bacterium]